LVAISGPSLTYSSPVNLSNCNSITNVQIVSNPWVTSITNPTASSIITAYYCYSNALTSLDLSGLSNIGTDLRGYSNTGLTTLTLPTINRQFTNIDFHNCALNTASVDAIFAKLNAWYSAHTPTADLSIILNQGTNARPTGGTSNTDLVNLQANFTGAGKFLSVSLHP